MNLDGRQAKCDCGKLAPSSPALAFFEFQGEGSERALKTCKHCHYFEVAHRPEIQRQHAHVCDHFEAVGAFEFDRWYCGCRGWD